MTGLKCTKSRSLTMFGCVINMSQYRATWRRLMTRHVTRAVLGGRVAARCPQRKLLKWIMFWAVLQLRHLRVEMTLPWQHGLS